jgi:8-oxo-dGTP pyrophosphatase MutT (NUDIX family)
MEVDRPAAGEELNTGKAPTAPRQAATVIVLRGRSETLEVLLVRRNPEQPFMGGAWVFPGGAVDATEGAGDAAHRACAVREAEEEAGLRLGDPATLVKFSRWITPAEVRVRFDTHFFLAPVPAHARPVPDGRECVALDWFTPRGALEAYSEGRLPLVFPTIKHLEQLASFGSATELMAWAEGREVLPVQPKVLLAGEVARVVLPGEPGYDA